MPSLQQKTCLTQRSRGFGHGVVVSKICYNAVIVLSVVLCDCCKPMNNCRDWAFSNSGLEVGLPGCQLEKCDSLPKRDLCGMLHDSAITCWSFKHPISARRRFLRAAVRSAISAFWLHHTHPFVAAVEKGPVSCREAEGFGHGVVVSKICCNAVSVLSAVLCDCCKPMNNCRDWAFSNSGFWKCDCQPFSCPCWKKCD